MTRNFLMRLLIVAMLGLLGSLGVAQASDDDDGVKSAAVAGTAKADKLDKCVRDTPFMRRNHFELIKHQRDITVHEGIRKTDDSLHGCVSCHARKDAQGKYVPVNAPGEFCAECHEEVAVELPCFSCHSAVPQQTAAANGGQAMNAEMFEKIHAGIAQAVPMAEPAQGTGN